MFIRQKIWAKNKSVSSIYKWTEV